MNANKIIQYLKTYKQEAKVYRHERKKNPVNYIVIKNGFVYLGDHKDSDNGSPLTASEIIHFLENHTHGNEIVVMDISNPLSALFIMSYDDDIDITIECEEDYGLYLYLDKKLKMVEDKKITEEECYQDLIEADINTKIVKKILGKEYGEHMHKFCKKHNII